VDAGARTENALAETLSSARQSDFATQHRLNGPCWIKRQRRPSPGLKALVRF
jgi:hypothetical protein